MGSREVELLNNFYGPCRTFEEAVYLSPANLKELDDWVNSHLGAVSADDRPAWDLSRRQWITYCESRELQHRLPSGEPNCSFVLLPEELEKYNTPDLAPDCKQILFWDWFRLQKQEGKTAGSSAQISRTRVQKVWQYLNVMTKWQFRGCGTEHSGYGEFSDTQLAATKLIKEHMERMCAEEERATNNLWEHTEGKNFTLEMMRAVQRITPVSWLLHQGNRQTTVFELLSLQAFVLHAWRMCRRGVRTRNIPMLGIFTEKATSVAMQGLSGSHSSAEMPLQIYHFVGSRDKGHGSSELKSLGAELYR